MQSQSPWILAPASKGGGGGQGRAGRRRLRDPLGQAAGTRAGGASEVRPIGRYLEPLARGRPPRGGPAPTSRPRTGGRRKTNTRWGHPALPAPRPQLARPGLDLRDLGEGSQVGENVVSSWRVSRGCRLGWDRFTVLLINVPATAWVPGSHMGPWKQRMVCCRDFGDVFPMTSSWCHVFFLMQTTLLASKQLKRAANRETRRGRESVRPARGFLGPVVLFAVGFIAQNTIDLVDNGG